MLDYFQKILEKARKRRDIVFKEYPLEYSSGTFPFFRFSSTNISPQDHIVLIAAGIHGDERCGPYTLQEHFEDIFDHAHSKGVKIIMYPLRNPSGYEKNTRYNCEEDMGSGGIGNNDFLRYISWEGIVSDQVKANQSFHHWEYADDPALGIRLTLEDQLLLNLLRKEPWGQIKEALDLHQDHLTEYLKPGAYHYSLDPSTDAYLPILKEISTVVPILTRTPIDGGFLEKDSEELFFTDDRGFIKRHDGSFDDLCHRLGVPHVVTAETSGEIPLVKADHVNLAWIKGMIDIVNRE